MFLFFALSLIGQQASRSCAGTSSILFNTNSKEFKEEISILRSINIVQIVKLEIQIVPHTVIKNMFDNDLLQYMKMFSMSSGKYFISEGERASRIWKAL